MTWSLSEIGVAAATHAHNYAGSGAPGGVANSAAKLATARTINGVAFDGTIPITITAVASGGNADTVDGKHANDAANQIALKSADNDINCRLLKQTYADQATISGGIVFRTNATTDNYLRVCNNTAAIRTYLELGNVNNTADSAKPISTAMQAALNLKANLVSPALSGTPTAPTAAVATNNTQIATTAFVKAVAAPTSHAHNYAGSSSAGGAANSAVKLATARQIDGVNFDGTSNILLLNYQEISGFYIYKYTNGIMHMRGNVVIPPNSGGGYSFTFPISFSNIPHICTSSENDGILFVSAHAFQTKTTVALYVRYNNNTIPPTSCTVSLDAKGRWKQ